MGFIMGVTIYLCERVGVNNVNNFLDASCSSNQTIDAMFGGVAWP